ncbi:MAG: FtsQ-type POTRA domain-containing protein [Candidatus Parcubacteria bacterium]|nr:FtsQ-type POTRA domain-containing protein [Candidatus Parcubacteria bacterium]
MWRHSKFKKYKINRPQIKYKNPFIKSRGKIKFKLIYLLDLLILIVSVGLIYFFLFSNFYKITDIQVSGNYIISTEDILEIINDYSEQKSLGIFKHSNILIFNKNAIKKRINEVVILEDIKVDKMYPNIIKISVKEKDLAFGWATNNQEYLVDKQGQIIKSNYSVAIPGIFLLSNDIKGSQIGPNNDNLLIIRDLSNTGINLGSQVLTTENVTFILDLQAKIKDKDYLKYREIQVPNEFPQYLTLVMVDNWTILFNLKDDLNNQLNRLNLLIEQKIKKENLNRIDYIDLRLGESIYYQNKQNTVNTQ